ncbi:MAG: hypothetical protein M1832_003219 [Thelocarpon impressellum]|nr:MAG: hypothetical protein M1832_003219 [Thelocarpon impressellum]
MGSTRNQPSLPFDHIRQDYRAPRPASGQADPLEPRAPALASAHNSTRGQPCVDSQPQRTTAPSLIGGSAYAGSSLAAINGPEVIGRSDGTLGPFPRPANEGPDMLPAGVGDSASQNSTASSLAPAVDGLAHSRSNARPSRFGNGGLDTLEAKNTEITPQQGNRRRAPGKEAVASSSPEDPTGSRSGSNSEDRNQSRSMEKDDGAPSWTELKTKAGRERKRLPLACIACRRKKIRCSGEKPACKHCVRARTPCVYKVTARKAAPRTDYMAMLDKRLKRMEDRIIKIIPGENAAKSAEFGRATLHPAAEAPEARKRSADEAFGAELNEWAKSTDADDGDVGHPGPPRKQSASDAERTLLGEGATALPPRQMQEHLVEVFFDCVYAHAYHLLHKPSFMRKFRAGKVPAVLILAICAVSARFSTHPDVGTEPAFLRGEAWATKAREIASRRFYDPNMTVLIVIILLTLHDFGTCQGGRSWALCGMAIRIAYALQLHRDLDHDPEGGDGQARLSSTDREIRRRAMWACFIMDRFNSSGSDRPTFVDEETLKVQLPIEERLFHMDVPGITESLDGGPSSLTPTAEDQLTDPKCNMGVVAYTIRVVSLWGHVIKYVNLGGKERDPHAMWSPKSHFAELQARAEEFRASFPDSLRYTPKSLQAHAAKGQANEFLFLHITSHQVELALNGHVIAPAPHSGKLADGPKEFQARLMQKAVESAGRISELIKACVDHLVTAPFIGYCAFMSGLVHIRGIFSKRPELAVASTKGLAHNVRYLGMMKKYWGMFHLMAQNLKDAYRRQDEAASEGETETARHFSDTLHYGDMLDRYPRGVSKTEYHDLADKQGNEPENETAMGQRPELQSVEEFFAGLSKSPTNGIGDKPASKTRAKRVKRPPKSNRASGSRRNTSSGLPSGNPVADDDEGEIGQTIQGQVVLDAVHLLGLNAQQSGDQDRQLVGQATTTAYTPPQVPTSQTAYPLHSPFADYPFLGSQEPGLMTPLDRQLVFGHCDGLVPISSSVGLDAGAPWDPGMVGFQPANMSDTPQPWIMPYSMQPPPQMRAPQVGNGTGIYASGSPGPGGYGQTGLGAGGGAGARRHDGSSL